MEVRAPRWETGAVSMDVRRCRWAQSAPDLERAYHDEEWGVPERDDDRLFELLTLEGAQAGLSWSTVLRKRPGYREAFEGFDAARVATFADVDVARLLEDPSIIRHRGKIESAVTNARAIVALAAGGSSLHELLWSFVGDRTLQGARSDSSPLPATSVQSVEMAKVLKRSGFAFVGPTTCYSLMQAAGLVNDHTTDCFRWPALGGRSEKNSRAGCRLNDLSCVGMVSPKLRARREEHRDV
jgi:DNA-3-methyladenine glycosylase I